MRHILVKEGARQPSVFSDFIETVNANEAPQVGFFTRVDPGLRLIRNRTREDRDCAFAIAHFQVDPVLPIQPRSHFHPINTDFIAAAADEHDFIMVGVVTQSHHVHDYKSILEVKYIVRDADGFLLDLITKERIRADGKVTFFTAFFGMVRVKGFPAYYMILNPNLVHVTDGFDYYESASNTMWTLLGDVDGNLKEALFQPEVLNGRIIGTSILTDEPYFNFSVLTSKTGVLRRESAVELFNNSEWTVETNLNYFATEGGFQVSSPKVGEVGFFELHLKCGAFFELANELERPTFKYVVHRYANS